LFSLDHPDIRTGMAASFSSPSNQAATVMVPSRFGLELQDPDTGERSMRWLLKNRPSMAPKQLLAVGAVLALLSLAIAAAFWMAGATLVLPFAGLEALAIGAALYMHARHVSDSDDIHLGRDVLTVLTTHAGRVDKVEFHPSWVRVEPVHGDGSLIELSGQGRRVAVGRFVRPERRGQLAEELRWALRRWHPGMA
jgi:uncharacterized membrane protein